MAKSLANCRAFSNDREATAATSASSHCSIPGTARRHAIDAALKIPHFTFFVMDSPILDVSGTLEDCYLQTGERHSAGTAILNRWPLPCALADGSPQPAPSRFLRTT